MIFILQNNGTNVLMFTLKSYFIQNKCYCRSILFLAPRKIPKKDIHEALRPISWLSGRWSTKEGKGNYPNIPDFSYHDEMEYVCIGQPMYNFTSTSRHPETLKPMHQERGFLRIKPGTNSLAFAVSHNFGVSSIEEGTYNTEKKEIILESNDLLRAQTKPPKVLRIRRSIKLLAPNRLEVILEMETKKTPLTEHLRAIYNKIPE